MQQHMYVDNKLGRQGIYTACVIMGIHGFSIPLCVCFITTTQAATMCKSNIQNLNLSL